MEEELAQAPETTESPETPAEQPASPAPPWHEWLNTAPAEELRRHPRWSGLVGSEVERQVRGRQKQWEAEQAESRRQAVEAREREVVQTVLQRLGDADEYVRQNWGSRIGSRLRELVGDDDFENWQTTTAAAMQGVADDDAIPTVVQHTIKHLLAKQVKAAVEEYRRTELPKEREALRKELAAQMLLHSEAPDLARPKVAGRPRIADMSDAEFEEHWRRVTGREG